MFLNVKYWVMNAPCVAVHSTVARSPKKIVRLPRMALKKSELYSSLWKSCDELRGGMDASQYKDNELVVLLADANDALKGAINGTNFNAEEKLGKGKEMVGRVTKLVGIFEGL